MKILRSQSLISLRDLLLFFDSMKEAVDLASMLVVISMKRLGIVSVHFGLNATFRSAIGKKLPELIRFVGFVGENGSYRKAGGEFEAPY